MRQHRPAPGQFAGRKRGNIRTIQHNGTAIRPDFAGHELEQGRLARTVRAYNHSHGRGLQLQIDRIDKGAATANEGEFVCCNHQSPLRPELPLRPSSRNRKTGVPMSAVTMPMGSSAGEATVRAMLSARMRSAAPPSAEPGSKKRCDGPMARRNRCGTMMPTKPMEPAAATVAPQAAATARMASRFTPLHRNAHVEGCGIAKDQRIEPARQKRNERQHHRDEGQDGEDFRIGGPAQRTERPEGDVAQRPVIGDEDEKAVAAPVSAAMAMPASTSMVVEVSPFSVAMA